MLKERATRLWARLVKKYRMVLYDHESLSQSRNVIFKPLTVVLVGSGALLGITMLTSLFIFNVPAIHRHIPGFQSHLSEDYKSLQRKNNELEREVAEMDSMLKVFTSALGSGDVKAKPDQRVWESAMPEPAQVTPDQEDHGQAAVSHQEEPGSAEVHTEGTGNLRPIVPQPRKGANVLNLVAPVDGYVTKDFEPKDKPHFGIDLGAEENSLVRSVADGLIVFSEYSNTTGYVVGIWHSKYNMISFYKHNSRLFKSVGAHVFAGEAIAVIGNTGINSSGTHLHFELWYDNRPVNPADYINFN